ncbi:MAG TPA: class I SAM-dependent methyltransferase [Acidimicrobiia bacterium]|jgi:SAM-dependent methyltransferase
MSHSGVPTADLPDDEKAKRSGSFGEVASLYERYRPGPPIAAVEWMLPEGCASVADLGAGTGALTRLLVDRVGEVIAVEPDDRMREVLGEQVPGARPVAGRGDAMPLPDNSVNAVLASSSWHWMDVVPTLHEVARVLTPGGTLGAVWSGPDPDAAFMAQARAMMAPGAAASQGALAAAVADESNRPPSGLIIPDGLPFDPPEEETFRFDVALTADDIIGLLATFSWIITLSEEQREKIYADARRLMREFLGLEGDATTDVGFRADTYRTRCRA